MKEWTLLTDYCWRWVLFNGSAVLVLGCQGPMREGLAQVLGWHEWFMRLWVGKRPAKVTPSRASACEPRHTAANSVNLTGLRGQVTCDEWQRTHWSVLPACPIACPVEPTSTAAAWTPHRTAPHSRQRSMQHSGRLSHANSARWQLSLEKRRKPAARASVRGL